jgi:F-type H+-transporting ATPase subunit delta
VSASKIARRYAKALFELASEQGKLEATGSELGSVAEAWTASRELRDALSMPLLPHVAKRKIMGELCQKAGTSTTVTSFLQLLNDRSRLGSLPQILEAFREYADRAAGKVRVEVKSAIALSKDQAERIRKELERLTGSSVQVEAAVDERLLGGVVARIGSVVLDGSLSSQLENLKEALRQ